MDTDMNMATDTDDDKKVTPGGMTDDETDATMPADGGESTPGMPKPATPGETANTSEETDNEEDEAEAM
jgi:hypothetical protein